MFVWTSALAQFEIYGLCKILVFLFIEIKFRKLGERFSVTDGFAKNLEKLIQSWVTELDSKIVYWRLLSLMNAILPDIFPASKYEY